MSDDKLAIIEELKIRKELKKLIANEILFSDFQRWFFAETCCVDDNHSVSLQKLVYSIKLLFAEFSHGDWTKAELFAQLKDLLAEDYYEDSIEDIFDEINNYIEKSGELTGFNVTTAKNKVTLREYAEKIKNAVKRLDIAIEMQHEISDEDWQKPCHGLKFTRRTSRDNRVIIDTSENNEPPKDFDAEQKCIAVLNKAIETLRSPEKPSLYSVLTALQRDFEDIEARNPISLSRRIRSLISGNIELINEFSEHLIGLAASQNYGAILGRFNTIKEYIASTEKVIDEYIPEEERRIVLEEASDNE